MRQLQQKPTDWRTCTREEGGNVGRRGGAGEGYGYGIQPDLKLYTNSKQLQQKTEKKKEKKHWKIWKKYTKKNNNNDESTAQSCDQVLENGARTKKKNHARRSTENRATTRQRRRWWKHSKTTGKWSLNGCFKASTYKCRYICICTSIEIHMYPYKHWDTYVSVGTSTPSGCEHLKRSIRHAARQD